MKLKKIICIALVTALMTSLAGCSRITEAVASTSSPEEEVLEEGVINTETSSLGIDSSSKKFEEELVDDTYYVVHEGIYYPVYTYMHNPDGEEEAANYVNIRRQAYYTADNYNDIPTFFPGDHLVYYSTNTMLDTINWERYYEFGPTFSFFDLNENTGGHFYLDFSDDEKIPVIPDSSLYEMTTLGVENILIDKVGGIAIDESVVDNGLISGATAGTHYDLEVYTGTYYKHYDTAADMYAFSAYELFASADTQTLQDCFWEVNIPDYFVNGYYDINHSGMLRILVDDYSYSTETDFNAQLLFKDDDVRELAVYSEVEPLNRFEQTHDSSLLGYVDPETGEPITEESTEDSSLPDAAQFRQANIKEYELWFPEGKECYITITSSSGESTGSAVIEFDTGGSTSLTYNRFDKNYTGIVNGKNNKGLLTISGFWYDYNIELVNVVVYEGQDLENAPAVDSDTTQAEVETEATTEEQTEATTETTDSTEE